MPQHSILAPDEGDKFWIVGDHLTFKAGPKQTGGQYTVAITWTPPGGGPPPHMHSNEDEMFYILEGTLQFVHGDQTFIGGAGTAVYLKKNIPHTFKNVGDKPARFLLTATPGGFESFIAEAGESITQIPSGLEVNPAAIDKLMKICPKHGLSIHFDHKPTGHVAAPPAGEQLWVLGTHVTIKLDSQATAGNYSVVEVLAQPGNVVPPHKHLAMDEYFYVLEGEFEFLIEGKPRRAAAGTFIHVPKNVLHGFANVSKSPAKLVDFHTPGGFEDFFKECGTPCTDATQPPKMSPPDMPALLAMFKKHGMELPG